MQSTDDKDLDEAPEKVAGTTATLARHAAHLATLSKERPHPAPPAS